MYKFPGILFYSFMKPQSVYLTSWKRIDIGVVGCGLKLLLDWLERKVAHEGLNGG